MLSTHTADATAPPLTQLNDGLHRAPRSLGTLSARGWRWAALYLVLSAAVLGGLALLLFAYEGGLRRVVLKYLFPTEIYGVADFTVQYVVQPLSKHLLANAFASGTLLIISLILFWGKERLSSVFETDARLLDGKPFDEPPLPRQMFEEIKLIVLYAAFFFVSFWVGHDPAPWRQTLAIVLSYLVLFFTYAVDFCAPILLRHRFSYSQVIKTLLKRPLAMLSFGAFFSMPVVGVAHLVAATDLSPSATLAIVFGTNLLAIVWACVAGTWLGARLFPVAQETPTSKPLFRAVTWAMVLGICAVGVYVAIALVGVLQGKSQLLKLTYDVDWTTLSVGKPSLLSMLDGKVETSVSFDVDITNPTPIDTRIEDNRLELSDGTRVLATGMLKPLDIPAGETRAETIGLDLQIDAKQLLSGFNFDPDSWRLTLYFHLTEDMEFPVYLHAPSSF